MNKWFKLLISIIISGIGLYYSFSKVNIQELLIHLFSVNKLWLFVGSALLILSVIIRAIRWQVMIESIDRVKINHLFSATMIGYFGNAIFPFRLGELLRAYAISKKSKNSSFSKLNTDEQLEMFDSLKLIEEHSMCFGDLKLIPFYAFVSNL